MGPRSVNSSKMKGGGDRLRRSFLNRLCFLDGVLSKSTTSGKKKTGQWKLKVDPWLAEPVASKIIVVVGFGLDGKINLVRRGRRRQPGEQSN